MWPERSSSFLESRLLFLLLQGKTARSLLFQGGPRLPHLGLVLPVPDCQGLPQPRGPREY